LWLRRHSSLKSLITQTEANVATSAIGRQVGIDFAADWLADNM